MPDENSYTVNSRGRTTGQVRKSVDAFIVAGLTAINDHGVDRLTVSQVTEIAGSTRPTFYSYFGNVGGLLAEIWLSRGKAFWERITDPTFRLEVSPPDVQKEMRALLEIFTVSRRFPEVAEILTPQVAAWWRETGGENEFVRSQNAWLIANRLGTWLTEPSEPRAMSSAIVETILPALGSTPPPFRSNSELAYTPALATPRLDDSTTESRLLDATIRVIAGSGANAATMSRIARNAHVTTGTIYPRFNNTELLLKSFEHAVARVTDQNFALISPAGFAPEQFGAIVRGGLAPSRQTWRNFRVEMYLEARYNPALANNLRDALHVTNARVSEGLGQLPIGKGERESIAFLIHTIGIGMAVLLNNSIPVDDMDHALLTHAMVVALGNR